MTDRCSRGLHAPVSIRAWATLPRIIPFVRWIEEGEAMRAPMLRSLIPSSLTALALVLLLAVPAAAARSIPANINTSARPGNEAEDAIAVNPTNPNNLSLIHI